MCDDMGSDVADFDGGADMEDSDTYSDAGDLDSGNGIDIFDDSFDTGGLDIDGDIGGFDDTVNTDAFDIDSGLDIDDVAAEDGELEGFSVDDIDEGPLDVGIDGGDDATVSDDPALVEALAGTWPDTDDATAETGVLSADGEPSDGLSELANEYDGDLAGETMGNIPTDISPDEAETGFHDEEFTGAFDGYMAEAIDVGAAADDFAITEDEAGGETFEPIGTDAEVEVAPDSIEDMECSGEDSLDPGAEDMETGSTYDIPHDGPGDDLGNEGSGLEQSPEDYDGLETEVPETDDTVSGRAMNGGLNPETAPELLDTANQPEVFGEYPPSQAGDFEAWEQAMGDVPGFEEHMADLESQEDVDAEAPLNGEAGTEFIMEEVPEAEQLAETELEPLTESEMDAVHDGLQEYDFQGVDPLEDTARLDESLENFTSENWENLSLDEQKENIQDLAQYVVDTTELEDPPAIEYYNNPVDGDYGGFDPASNTLRINEHMLYQNDEAADTVAHELWHAVQHQRASDPKSRIDQMYAENFRDYITPSEDYEGYQSQIIESEARAFAQQIKDRLKTFS